MSKKRAAGTSTRVRSWLIEAREKKGMTQGQVAAAAEIAQPSYFEIEKGISTPRPETAKRIGAALGFAWVKFYEDEDESWE